MLLLVDQAAAAPAGVPPWALWLAGIIGVASLVFAVVRNSRRLARTTEGDLPTSEAQRRWNTAQKGKGRAAGPKQPTPPADHLPGDLSDRIAELRELIVLADQRIEELRALAPSRTANPTRGSRSGSHAEFKPGPPPRQADGPSTRIYQLADDGLSPRQIAAQTGQSESEINLMLALRH